MARFPNGFSFDLENRRALQGYTPYATDTCVEEDSSKDEDHGHEIKIGDYSTPRNSFGSFLGVSFGLVSTGEGQMPGMHYLASRGDTMLMISSSTPQWTVASQTSPYFDVGTAEVALLNELIGQTQFFRAGEDLSATESCSG